jgi:hypothetical protein
MRKLRSYQQLLNEIINLQIPFRVEIIGYVTYETQIYPMLAIKHISKLAKKNVVILSGQHGDEHYAVHVLLKWIQQAKMENFVDFNFHIFPVCNPFGYLTGSRGNGAKQDTNNDSDFCRDSKVPELAVLYENFPSNADLIFDIHGDSRKKNVYMYEHKAESLASIAEKAMLDNDILLPYLKQKTIDKIKVTNGVIIPPPYDVGIEGAIEKLGANYTITLELPGVCEGQKRAAGGVAIIESVLKYLKETTNGTSK